MGESIDINIKLKEKLFQAVELGDMALTQRLLSKGIDIDSLDEEGNTLLHHAAKWRRGRFVDYLLKRQANVYIKNKKGRTALLEAYTYQHSDIAKKLTQAVIERNFIKSIVLNRKKLDSSQVKFENFINECKAHISKNYLNRGLFSRLMARHTERAKTLVQALGRCTSIKEFKSLIRNQRDLFESRKVITPPHLLHNRWSTQLKNKPKDLNKSCFYKVLTTMPGRKLPIQNRINRMSSQFPIRN